MQIWLALNITHFKHYTYMSKYTTTYTSKFRPQQPQSCIK